MGLVVFAASSKDFVLNHQSVNNTKRTVGPKKSLYRTSAVAAKLNRADDTKYRAYGEDIRI